MEAVLFDPAVIPPTAGSLPAQPPAPLVDRDRFEPVSPGTRAQPPGRGKASHATTQDHDPATAHAFPERIAPAVSASGTGPGRSSTAERNTSSQSDGRSSSGNRA